MLTYGGSDPNGLLATIFIHDNRKLVFQFSIVLATKNASRKDGVSKMIETKAEVSRDLEKALQELEQAKQRVANAKRKQNEKRRKAENHHKYIMGGIIVKYFPDCYSFDEGELNRILQTALQTKECQQMISRIRTENIATPSLHSTLSDEENESEGGEE